MGYQVSSIYAVSPNDTHAFFIYFIPSHKFEWQWINEWMGKNFKRIAGVVGPHKGVIIAPTLHHNDDYLSSIFDFGSAGCFLALLMRN